MIFLTNNYSEKMDDLLNSEKQFFKLHIESQKKFKVLILKYMQNIVDFNNFDQNCASNILGLSESLKKSLELCNNNISLLEILSNDYENVLESVKNNEKNEASINSFNSKFSILYSAILQSTLTIQECLQKIEDQNYNLAPDYTDCSKFEPIAEQPIKEYMTNNDTIDIAKDSEVQANTTYNQENTVNIDYQHNSDSIANSFFNEPIINNSCVVNNSKNIDNENINIDSETTNISEKDSQITSNSALNLDSILSKIPNNENNIEIELSNAFVENTLVVSEVSGKVTLPYTLNKLNTILKENSKKYSSISEIIRKNYTLPIDMFKNPFIARFKEAFKLMRNKEKASIIDSLELGAELMFNSNLYPAIISACKNLDELDMYLDYLEEGDTQKFNCFDIVFETPPAVIK